MADASLNIIIGTLTQAQAAASSLVLRSGQGCFTSDTRRLYYGDGTSTLAQLVTAGAYLLPHPEFLAELSAAMDATSADLRSYADGAAQDAYDDAKAYTDNMVASSFRPAGNYDAALGVWPTAGTGPAGTVRAGDVYKVIRAGDIGLEQFDIGDNFYAVVDAPGQDDDNWARFEANDNQATESFRGTARIAENGEMLDGTNDDAFVTPLKWWHAFSRGFSSIGHALRVMVTPAESSFLRMNPAGNVSPRTASEVRTDLGLGSSALKDIGTGPGTVCAGDDARLSDARTPAPHSHSSGDVTDFAIATRGTLLTSMVDTDSTDLASTDTILQAIGKAWARLKNATVLWANLGVVRAKRTTQFDYSGTALTDVPDLEVTIPANSTYDLDVRLMIRSPATATGVNVTLSFTESPSIGMYVTQLGSSSSTQRQMSITSSDYMFNTITSITEVNTWLPSHLRGFVITGASPSVVRVRIARGGTSNIVSVYGTMKGIPV